MCSDHLFVSIITVTLIFFVSTLASSIETSVHDDLSCNVNSSFHTIDHSKKPAVRCFQDVIEATLGDNETATAHSKCKHLINVTHQFSKFFNNLSKCMNGGKLRFHLPITYEYKKLVNLTLTTKINETKEFFKNKCEDCIKANGFKINHCVNSVIGLSKLNTTSDPVSHSLDLIYNTDFKSTDFKEADNMKYCTSNVLRKKCEPQCSRYIETLFEYVKSRKYFLYLHKMNSTHSDNPKIGVNSSSTVNLITIIPIVVVTLIIFIIIFIIIKKKIIASYVLRSRRERNCNSIISLQDIAEK